MKSAWKKITERDLNRERKWYEADMETYRNAKDGWTAGYWYGVSRVRLTMIEEMEDRLENGHEKTARDGAAV